MPSHVATALFDDPDGSERKPQGFQQQQQLQQQQQAELMQRQQQQQLQQTGDFAVAPSEAELLINSKHDEYNARCKKYRILYYVTRLAAGLGAALLPFFVSANPRVATGLSLLVLIAVVFDQVFNPKDKWALYSKATDLLMKARLRAQGQYEKHGESLKILEQIEDATLANLSSVEELLAKVRGLEHHK